MSLNAEDTSQILQLYARYNTAIDTGDHDGFAACFVEKGHFDSGMGALEGTDAIAGFAKQTHANLPGMRHQSNNIVVDGDGTSATGSAFLIGYLVDGGFKVLTTGRYADELTKSADGWRFTKRVYSADQ